MRALEPPGIDEILEARERIDGLAFRTPLIPLDAPEGREVYLKLENLQPIGSFKVRGAGNALRKLGAGPLAAGVYTASAGNMAQGVAWAAREMGVPCSVVVPDHAPETKLAATRRLGARVVKVPFEDWWRVIVSHGYSGMEGTFLHPVANADVVAGNGTIGLEILEDLPEVRTVLVPFGGGGLSSGIAAALRARSPETRVYACEVETAAPLAASLARGEATEVERVQTFVDGIGGKSVLEEMWPMVRELLAGSLVTTVARIADAIRLLVERHRIVAEGAGAAPVAVALGEERLEGPLVCVVSGGNIDAGVLSTILAGRLP